METFYKRRGRKSQKPPMEELFGFYKTHTAEETAEHFNVKAGTIRRWLTEYRKAGQTDVQNDQ